MSDSTIFGLAPDLSGSNWMSRFTRDTSLAELTLPGTHDSAALFNLANSPAGQPLYEFISQDVDQFVLYLETLVTDLSQELLGATNVLTLGLSPTDFGAGELSQLFAEGRQLIQGFANAPLAQAQTMTIEEQLEAGVRLLDLRGRKYDDELQIFHGPIPQNQDFDEALATVIEFLDQNPTETVVVYTQEERGLPLPFDPYTPGWIGQLVQDQFGTDVPEAFDTLIFKLGHNLGQFLTANKDQLATGRPDWFDDIKSNVDGAISGLAYTSTDALRNNEQFLVNNYGIQYQPITQQDLLFGYYNIIYAAQFNLLTLPLARDLLNLAESASLLLNAQLVKLGVAWLEGVDQYDYSFTRPEDDGDVSTLNGAYDSGHYDDIVRAYIDKLGADHFYLDNKVPTLDEAAGKIVLMLRDNSDEHLQAYRQGLYGPGIDLSDKADNATEDAIPNTQSPIVVTQDYWNPSSATDDDGNLVETAAQAKWRVFDSLLGKAAANTDDPENGNWLNAMYINYLSANDTAAYANFDLDDIGPAGFALNAEIDIGGTVYTGLNDVLRDRFLATQPDGRYGTLVTDFMLADMARGIFEKNAAVGSAMALAVAAEPTIMRVDTAMAGQPSLQAVSFGLKLVGADNATMILHSHGPASYSHVFDADDANWMLRESLELGDVAKAEATLSTGFYVPVAYDAAGNELAILKIVANDPAHVEVTFAADGYVNPTAVYKLEGTGGIVLPADTDSLLQVEVARLGRVTNGLAFYEADEATGAINVGGVQWLPEDPGYLEAALSLAQQAGTVIRGDQMPAYGASTVFTSLGLEANVNYGLLVLHGDDGSDLSAVYSDANVNQDIQIVELPGPDGQIWLGVEDIRLSSGVSDGDFNDLLVNISAYTPA